MREDPAKLASGPVPRPEGSPPLEPKVTVENPIEAGSRSLIGGDAKLKYPRALATIGGAEILKALGYDKEASPLSPFLTTSVSLDISQEFVLLKAAEKADLSGSEFASELLCGHKWFPSALASIPRSKRESRLLWLENTYRAGGSAGDNEEPKHDFWYTGFILNQLKNQALINQGETKNISYAGFKLVMEETLGSIQLMVDKNDPHELGTLVRGSWSKLKSVPVPKSHVKGKRTVKTGSSLSKRFKGQPNSTAAKAPQAPAEELTNAAVELGGGPTGVDP